MEDNIKYQRAKKRVKEIKGFYFHLMIFILVNALIIFAKYMQNETYETGNVFGMAMWGLGLTAHGLSVFLPGILFGRDWEERKIREYMKKNR